jgi:hypothetical protein
MFGYCGKQSVRVTGLASTVSWGALENIQAGWMLDKFHQRRVGAMHKHGSLCGRVHGNTAHLPNVRQR